MKKLLFLLTLACVAFGCALEDKSNPFFSEWKTPFAAPPFQLIEEEHFLPAFEQGIGQNRAEIDALLADPGPPGFENTIAAYARSGELLRRVRGVFDGLTAAATNDRLQAIARTVTPLLSAHTSSILLDQELFGRIKAVHEARQTLGLDSEQLRLVEKIFQDFERGGAALAPEAREELRQISDRISMVSLQLTENLLAENNGFKLVLAEKAELAGLPPDVVAGAAERARRQALEGKWLFDLTKPSWIPFLQFSRRRDLREKLFRAYCDRGDNGNEWDNKQPFLELMGLRQRKARLLGYSSYADFFLDIQMAENPDNVYEFLRRIWTPALARARQERDDMQAIIDREGGGFELAAWDWWYYSEKVRGEKFALDEDELRPFFSIENVKQGCFYVSNRLFGLTFKRRPDIPVYHEEVEAYEVFDRDGSHLSVLYIDPHPRPGKRSGAWCTAYRPGSYKNGVKISPVVTMVMNFSRPLRGRPALLSWDETRTYFHEFGHALHNFFADGRYLRTSRSVPRDFVELPSQVLENWAGEPEVLQVYARHHQTGEPIGAELVGKMQKSALFNQGFEVVEYTAAAFLDMDWHTAQITGQMDVNEFEAESMQRIGLIDEIVPRYRTTNFGHIFGSAYAAGYYVYYWAGRLDADAFEAFKDSGDLFDPELAARFRKYILAENALGEGMELYLKFRGKAPSIEPFLRQRGLK